MLEILAVEITGKHIGNAPILTDLLGQILAEQKIDGVTAGGANDARKCHDAIAGLGENATITLRNYVQPWKTATSSGIARNEDLSASKHIGCAQGWRWSGCHRRSRIKTKMHSVKPMYQ